MNEPFPECQFRPDPIDNGNKLNLNVENDV